MNIQLLDKNDFSKWDQYVMEHPDSTHCHLLSWRTIFEMVYNRSGYYFVAKDKNKIVGILPLIHIKSRIFGNQLVSMPYLNCGGILADDQEILNSLISEAENIAVRLNVDKLELRQHYQFSDILHDREHWHVNLNKILMVLELPHSSELLFNSFPSKLRSQIRRPQKEGMFFKIGGTELVNDFYQVFSENMRDLGSPVHKKKLFLAIQEEFRQSAKIGVVYLNSKPVAGGLIITFKNQVEIPWASSLRKFNKFSPNMLLYWSFLEYAVQNNFQYFDFGRSSPSAGTYKFKAQWGCKEKPLFWYEMTSKTPKNAVTTESRSSMFFKNIWVRLPLPIANYIGPRIRDHIPL